MEKKELLTKIRELQEAFSEDIEKELDKILKSGCVDLSKYENNYLLPKIIFSAILKRETSRFTPLCEEYRQEVTNISRFL